MRMFFQQFFMGRTGFDRLNKLMLTLAVILWVASRFAPSGWTSLLFYLFLLAAGVCIFRSLSRNLTKRQEENARLDQWLGRVKSGPETWSNRREQRSQYKVFKCPGCGTKLRVPRGEGKIRVTCRQCGAVFEKKS